MSVRAVVRFTPSQIANDDTAAKQSTRLEVGERGPVVANVRVGERDDLACIAGVGDDLLVARQHRIEHHFAAGDARGRSGANEFAFEHTSVGENEGGFLNRHSVHPCIIIQNVAYSFIAEPGRQRQPDCRQTPCGGPCLALNDLRMGSCGSCWRVHSTKPSTPSWDRTR